MNGPASTRQQHGTPGKYQLVAELGHGGMAEVHLARMHGAAGFDKLVVIKRIREDLTEEPEMLAMFLDEARLAARLTHANVVQTYEIGQDGDRYFLAMEYLDGQSLQSVRHRLRADGGLPLAMQIGVLVDVLAGLHYAHELADFDGAPLGVVHRDVTQQNVLLTYDGAVKVVDFGIAKARCSSVETGAGVVKGKVTYMAPEQVRGERVDRRADVFAVGVLLWEAVTGKRPWPGLDDVTIARRLLAGGFPKVRDASPDVPDELEAILQKALALAPEGRYATAADFQVDLEAYLERRGERMHARDLGHLLERHFAADRARLRAILGQQVRDDRMEESRQRTSSPAAERTTLPEPAPPASRPAQASMTESGLMSERSMTRARPPRRRLVVLAAAMVLAAAGLTLALPSRLSHHRAAPSVAPAAPQAALAEPAAEVALYVSATPSHAALFLDGAPIGSGAYRAAVRRDGCTHEIRVEAPGFASALERVVFDRDRDVTFTLAVAPSAEPNAAAVAPAATSRPRARPGGERHRLDERNPYLR